MLNTILQKLNLFNPISFEYFIVKVENNTDGYNLSRLFLNFSIVDNFFCFSLKAFEYVFFNKFDINRYAEFI